MTIRCPHIAEEDWAGRGRFCSSDYGPGHPEPLNAQIVCNGLIHSYKWSLVQEEDGQSYSGFLVSSDHNKEKHVHFVSFDEWQRLIKLSIKTGAF